MKNTRFPNIWLGYAIATLILLLIIVIPKTPKGSAGLLLLAFIMLLLLKVIYWCFCVYRIHKVIMGMTDNCYPITPGRAVGFGFIPIYNIYWMFKWPAEIINFVNTRDKSRKLKPWVPGCFFSIGILAGWIYGPLWLFIDFVVLAYIINVLKKGVSADSVPAPYKERPKGMPVMITIMLGLLVILPIIGLVAGAAVPFLTTARKAAARDACVSTLKYIQMSKTAWASDTGAAGNATPTWEDLVPKYMHNKPSCPDGGAYTIGSIDSNPTCNVGNNNTARTKDDHILK